MSSEEGTGVGETVVLMEKTSTGPTKRFQRSLRRLEWEDRELVVPTFDREA
jgi:hypothetical protein